LLSGNVEADESDDLGCVFAEPGSARPGVLRARIFSAVYGDLAVIERPGGDIAGAARVARQNHLASALVGGAIFFSARNLNRSRTTREVGSNPVSVSIPRD
jgi:hypothetical protein